MATKKQVEANRRNAKLSTGPTTPAGQARSSQNALKHGLTAKEVTLDEDEAEQFAAFRDELIREFDPVGPLERELAQHAALLFWRRRRVARLEVTKTRCFSDRECGVNAPVSEFMSDGFRNLMRYESSLDRTLQRTLRDLLQVQTLRREDAAARTVDLTHNITTEIDGTGFYIQAVERWVYHDDGTSESKPVTGEELDQLMPKLAEHLNKERASRAR